MMDNNGMMDDGLHIQQGKQFYHSRWKEKPDKRYEFHCRGAWSSSDSSSGQPL